MPSVATEKISVTISSTPSATTMMIHPQKRFSSAFMPAVGASDFGFPTTTATPTAPTIARMIETISQNMSPLFRSFA